MPSLNFHINKLSINNFRNLTTTELNTSKQFNIFYGNNGSGKTSILEAINYMSVGKSFRTSAFQRIIQHNQQEFQIFLQTTRKSKLNSLGLSKNLDGSRNIHINGEKERSAAALAQHLPVIFIDTHSYRYFHDGPKLRRSFMDFGLFHVEQSFHSHWKKLQSVLRQRNASLKQGLSYNNVSIWDEDLVFHSNTIDQLRSSYLSLLRPLLDKLLQELLGDLGKFSLNYNRGWSFEEDIGSLLKNGYFQDRRYGATQNGPHRADLSLECNGLPVKDVLSQGQQKIASYVLYLAQGLLMSEKMGIAPIFLIDDLPSELDSQRSSQLIEILIKLDSQIFITGIKKRDLLDWEKSSSSAMFHVEHGCIKLECSEAII